MRKIIAKIFSPIFRWYLRRKYKVAPKSAKLYDCPLCSIPMEWVGSHRILGKSGIIDYECPNCLFFISLPEE